MEEDGKRKYRQCKFLLKLMRFLHKKGLKHFYYTTNMRFLPRIVRGNLRAAKGLN